MPIRQLSVKLILLISLLTSSQHAFALNGFFEDKSPEQLISGIYILLGILVLLLVMPIVQFYYAELRAKVANEETERNKRILNAVDTGIVHLDLNGIVKYVNDTSLSWFKVDESQLLNKALISVFDTSDHSDIRTALRAEPSVVEAQVLDQNTLVSLRFDESFYQGDDTLRVILVRLVEPRSPHAFGRIEERDNNGFDEPLLAEHDQANIETPIDNIAIVNIDLRDDTFTHDMALDHLLNMEAPMDATGTSDARPLSIFEQRIKQTDMGLWREALKRIKREDMANVNLRMLQNGEHDEPVFIEVHIEFSKPKATEDRISHSPTESEFAQFQLSIQPALNMQASQSALSELRHECAKAKHQIQGMQQSLARADKFNEQLLSLSPSAVGLIDKDHNIISANEAMLKRFKYGERELTKGNIYSLFMNTEEATKVNNSLKEHGRVSDFHCIFKGKDGKAYPGELTIEVLDDQKQAYLFWIIDRADEQFQRDKFENLLQHSSMPLAILTDEGFSKYNQAASDFFGVDDKSALLGIYPFDTSLNRSEEEAIELKSVVDKARINGKVQNLTWTHMINGQSVPCDITITPIYKDQDFDSVLCLWTDFRELTKVTEQLRSTNERVEEAQDEIEQTQSLLLSHQLELDNKTNALTQTQNDLTQTQESLLNTQSQFSELQGDYDSTRENFSQLEGELKRNRELLDAAEKNNTHLSEQLEQVVAEAKALTQQREDIEKALVDTAARNHRAQQDAIFISKQTFALHKERSNTDKELEALREQLALMKQQVSEKDEQLNTVTGQISMLEDDVELAQANANRLEQKLEEQALETEASIVHQRELEGRDKSQQQELSETQSHLSDLSKQLADVEKQAHNQQSTMRAEQTKLTDELNATLAKLSQAESDLLAAKAASAYEKAENEKYDDTLENLSILVDAAKSEADEQREALKQSEQQWRKEQESLNEQREMLEQTLAQTNDENTSLKAELEERAQALAEAKKAVDVQQQGQAELRKELNEAKHLISTLQTNIVDKADEAAVLSAQLKDSEEQERKELQSIQSAEEKSLASEAKLQTLENEYKQSKSLLMAQEKEQAALKEKLMSLESVLASKEQDLARQVNALQEATQELSVTKNKLSQQERALIAMQAQESSTAFVRPDIESLPLPVRPQLWFDLRKYVQTHDAPQSLFEDLKQLIDDIESHMALAEEVINNNDVRKMATVAGELVSIAKILHSEALLELTQSVEKDCHDGLVDNVSIRWPSTKAALNMSLRAVYEHLT
ncbi:PAS domain-containing protein [Ningiella sp. W23]|uniref:PAS domain-containing protein n=1 Tax=Ningiella sp. W23 TaxID=3023715 RepID=UPI0037573D0E